MIHIIFNSDVVKAGTGAPVTVVMPEEYLKEENLCDITFEYTAEYSKIDFQQLVLSFYNEETDCYYRVPFTELQQSVITKLPEGIYSLEYTYYDSYPNENYKTVTDPEKFMLSADGIWDLDGSRIDFVLIHTKSTLKTVYLNDFNLTFDVYSQLNKKFQGSVILTMEGDTDTEHSTHEVYQLEIDDIYSKRASIQMKAGRYHIKDIRIQPTNGEKWNICYDTGNLDICHYEDTNWKMAIYSDIDLLDLRYIEKLKEDGSTWTSTERISYDELEKIRQINIQEQGSVVEDGTKRVSIEEKDVKNIESIKSHENIIFLFIVIIGCAGVFYYYKKH